MNILIDDIRNLPDMDIILRTPKAAQLFINGFDATNHVLFMDNDLGDPDDLEGHHILSMMLEFGQRPKTVVLVTSNIIAKDKMMYNLCDNGYESQPPYVEFTYKGG